MQSGILKLEWSDIIKALILGVIVLGVVYLNQTFNLLDGISPEIKASLLAGISYLLKNLFTSDKGNVLGVIPTK